MSYKNMLLSEGGYFFPGSYQPSPFPYYSGFPPRNLFSLSTLPIIERDLNQCYSPSPSVNSLPVDISSVDRDFRIVPWDELNSLLPEDLSNIRMESGLLPDGRAFAQRSPRREAYLLFPSKSAYILYFMHHYFSRENLDRDKTLRGMMVDNCAVAIDKITQAPRLVSICTTVDDIKQAVENGSNILCVFNGHDGHLYIRRLDGYPGSAHDLNSSLAVQPEGGIQGSLDGSLSRSANIEYPVPSNSADPEFAQSWPAVFSPSMYGAWSPNSFEAAQMYPAQNASVAAAASAISRLCATMGGVNLGQPSPPRLHHPLAQAAPQLFNQLDSMSQSLAATLAAFSYRNPVPAFSQPFALSSFSTDLGRSVNPILHSHQSQIYHQHHRRISPSSVSPPPHTTSSTNAVTNALNLQLPGTSYSFPNPHGTASSANFEHGTPTRTYDSWIPQVTPANLFNSNLNLQYSPHITAWPQQNYAQLKTSFSPQHIHQHPQPINMLPLSSGLPLNNLNSGASFLAPGLASLQSAVATTSTDTTRASEIVGNRENAFNPSNNNSTTTITHTNLDLNQIPSGRVDSSKVAVKEASDSEISNRRPSLMTQQGHSRPISDSGKVNSKSHKGGNYQRDAHSVKSPPNATETPAVPAESSENSATLGNVELHDG